MRVVVGSDEATELTDAVVADLRERGHDVVLVGPLVGDAIEWADVGRAVGEAVASGDADTGVCFCWTGTGVSIAANKVAGVRAALCQDAATAGGARRWNDANVVVMSLRAVSPAVAREIVDAWLTAEFDAAEAVNVAKVSGPLV
ncbi:MAG: RpiB/LacA/LacB family sugar-phosphate isomerase [Acidimicrobiia bacterium]|nr:RpiB/LacA/LacB family sugar-phosphate isomerase [Acidimicrobiia bacterium]